MVGASATLTGITASGWKTVPSANLDYGLEAYSRYYLLKGRFKLFTEVSTGLTWQRTKTEENDLILRSSTGPVWNANATVGASYFLGKTSLWKLSVPVMNMSYGADGAFRGGVQAFRPQLGVQFFLR